MTTELPNITDTSQYNVTQAAKILGVDRKTILRKVQTLQLKAKFRRDTGRKFFTGYKLKRFWKSHL